MNFDLMKVHRSLMYHYNKSLLLPLYRKLMAKRVKKMRQKDVINVLFIISEVGPWKTKELYKAMLKHPRFNPTLGVTMSLEVPLAKKALMDFLKQNNFDFVDLDLDWYLSIDKLHPDIIFYQKPYDWCYRAEVMYNQHLNSLFCNVNYGFHSVDSSWIVSQPLYSYVWQQYYENDLVLTPERLAAMPDKGKQVVITGLPFQDQLVQPKEAFENPWKPQPIAKKKIIYAPHHSIGGKGLALSSFLENCDFMLGLMHQYADKVQWAFKPHPLLYNHLVEIWGQDKTDAYYNEWKNAENSQFENGGYDGLFKYSDAMIHDCDSFTVEYLYAHRPVMFLLQKKETQVARTKLSQKAFDLHYKASTKEQVEQFILNVIDNIDSKNEEREEFYQSYLVPPHGKSASQNIMNAILGEEEYKSIN